MSGDRGVSLPVAALGVLAFVFSAGLLTHHAFDVLRIGEGDVAKERLLSQPPVEARLWEDPLAAIVRHKDRLKAICSTPKTNASDPASPEAVRAGLPPQCPEKGSYGSVLPFPTGAKQLSVIAALVPGSSFVGVEEARRRMRYAVLTGLASQGFVPQHGERLGLLTVPLCTSFDDCPPDKVESGSLPSLDVAYEILKTETSAPPRSLAILWLDDSKLGAAWLSNVALLLGNVVGAQAAKLSVIGPYSSDKLADALKDVAALGQKAGACSSSVEPASSLCTNG
jgi:hypothetical protein